MTDAYLHGVRVNEINEGTRPIRTIPTSVIGVVVTAPLADAEAFPLDTPVLIAGNQLEVAKLGTTGTGPAVLDAIFDQGAAMVVVVRVADDVDPAAQKANVIGTITAQGKFTGLKALQASQSANGLKPRILGAPGFDYDVDVANELVALSDKLRGFTYVPCLADTKEDAVLYRDNFGSKRIMCLWPDFSAFDVNTQQIEVAAASARALGMRAKIDNDIGWHKTLSNVPVNGVSGITHDVDWDLTSAATAANYLNENEITTLIRKDGFRFWGSRTCSADPLFAFENYTRTGDIIADTIAEAHLWAMDKPMSKTLIRDIVGGVQAKMDEWVRNGYLIGAECWYDPELNTPDTLKAGKLLIDYDYTPVPPLENLGFNQRITDRYLMSFGS